MKKGWVKRRITFNFVLMKDKIKVWIKLREHFVAEDNVRAIYRLGNDTKLERILGNAIVVNIEYDKVVKMFPTYRS
ncbi:MAG: hypothetical protein JKY42_02255 [Flavobacteriales bacterium]|nr:hypothetical protein [Flavobacteriales bacterium]